VAEVDLDEDKYKHWSEQYHEACRIVNRKEQKKQQDRLAEEIEKKLVLVGVAAIEDKLQEGVPEAIETLRRANINVWMLTGDKLETAINIGYSCQLLIPEMSICKCTEEEMTSQSESSPFVDAVKARLRDLKANYLSLNSALIVDGKALDTALEDAETKKLFFQVAQSCRSVICCRMTPGQKAGVVKVTKKFHKNATTLAIGDGANDVSMIQAADIGVGISGAEGLQATLASDFSMTQFRFLVRLLLVHGVWNYKRTALVIFYSFYKNIVLYVMEFWFAWFNMFSGQIIFERWTIGFYNVFFTFFPPVALGIADQDIQSHARLSDPECYTKTQKGHYFNLKLFVVWMAIAVFHSLALFGLVEAGLFTDIVTASGYTGGLWFHGNLLYTATLFVVSGKIFLIAHSWNVLLVVSVVVSVVLWLIFLPVYGSVWPGIPVGVELVGVAQQLYASGYFYAFMLLSPFAILFFDIMYMAYCSLSFSTWFRRTRGERTRFLPDHTTLLCFKCYCYSRLPRSTKVALKQFSRCFPFIHCFYDSYCCDGEPDTVWTPQPSQTDYDEINETNCKEMKQMKSHKVSHTSSTNNSNNNNIKAIL
jgi:phospholipid-transporting ATPase